MHSLRLVPNVQRNRQPAGETAGEYQTQRQEQNSTSHLSHFTLSVEAFKPSAVSFTLQLLEDVEDTLSCTTFEEDSLSRKLNCECFFVNALLGDSLMFLV